MWKGQLSFETPMLWALGFVTTFLFGGLSGVILASPPLDFHITDTYFIVAHFHYVLFGTIVFATFGGIYLRFPKFTGRFLDERLGRLHFWTTFLGFHTTFLVQHRLGAQGMLRRYADYLPSDGFTTLNTISTIESFIVGFSMITFVWNVFTSYRYGEVVTADDPWGYGNSLEWATSSPPPRHNFYELPRIRSERFPPGVRHNVWAPVFAARLFRDREQHRGIVDRFETVPGFRDHQQITMAALPRCGCGMQADPPAQHQQRRLTRILVLGQFGTSRQRDHGLAQPVLVPAVHRGRARPRDRGGSLEQLTGHRIHRELLHHRSSLPSGHHIDRYLPALPDAVLLDGAAAFADS